MVKCFAVLTLGRVLQQLRGHREGRLAFGHVALCRAVEVGLVVRLRGFQGQCNCLKQNALLSYAYFGLRRQSQNSNTQRRSRILRNKGGQAFQWLATLTRPRKRLRRNILISGPGYDLQPSHAVEVEMLERYVTSFQLIGRVLSTDPRLKDRDSLTGECGLSLREENHSPEVVSQAKLL